MNRSGGGRGSGGSGGGGRGSRGVGEFESSMPKQNPKTSYLKHQVLFLLEILS